MTNEREKRDYKPILVIIAAVIILAGLYLFSLYIPYLVSSTEGNNNYFIKISGLNSLKASGETTIMIPLPVYIDREPVFSENMLKRFNDEPDVYRIDSDWNLSVENTPYGDMMVLKTSKTELSDLNIRLAEFDLKSKPRLLMPALNISGELTAEEFSKKENGEYESSVYINGTFFPVDKSIQFNLEYIGGGEKKFAFQANIWKLSLSKSLLSGDTGFSNAGVHYVVTDVW